MTEAQYYGRLELDEHGAVQGKHFFTRIPRNSETFALKMKKNASRVLETVIESRTKSNYSSINRYNCGIIFTCYSSNIIVFY